MIFGPPPLPPSQQEVQMCMKQAEIRYQVPACILNAIHVLESGQSLRTDIQNANTNGTDDYSPMQINTVWVNYFQKNFGVTAQQLKVDICLSVHAAAYVVRYEINRSGDFWTGVGLYHSPTATRNISYRTKVAAQAQRFGCRIQ